MDIKIKKARLAKNGGLEVAYTDTEGNEVTVKGVNPVHRDMREAFVRLIPFLADLTEQREADNIQWDDLEGEYNKDLLKRMDVTGITVSSDDISDTVTITGRRTLSVTKKVLCLNTPAISLDQDSEDYENLSELTEAIDAVKGEAKLYITERKYSVVQTEIDFNNPDDPFGEGEAGESQSLKEEAA